MRILHCIASLMLGGAERQVSVLAPELTAMGHDVQVAYLHEGPHLRRLQAHGVKPHNLKFHFTNYDPRLLWQMVALIRRNKPDIVQTWLPLMDLVGGMACVLTGTPWVLREASSANCYPRSVRGWLRARLAARYAVRIVANSQAGRRYWQAQHPRCTIVVVPNSVPLPEIETAKALTPDEMGLPDGNPFVLYVGRLEEMKNLDRLILALKILNQHGCKVHAVLCGDGAVRPRLESLIRENRLEHCVHFKGWITNVYSYLKAAPVFVSISNYEGRPNTVLEAMASNCPVVVSDIPEHREFLNDSTAILVDPHDPEQIACAIRATLQDPEGARARARAARESIVNQSVQAMAGQYAGVYTDVLQPNGRQPKVDEWATQCSSSLLNSLYSLGTNISLRFNSGRSGLIILGLHHVFKDEQEVDSPLTDPMQRMTVAHFSELVQCFLEDGYTFIGPDDLVRHRLERGKYALITFDDGYVDNLNVLPILHRYQIPISIHVPTHHMLTQESFWWDVVYRERRKQGWSRHEVEAERNGLKSKPYREIDDYLKRTFGPEALVPPNETSRMMTAEEVRAAGRDPYVHFGNHTHNHVILWNCSFEEARQEIKQCQDLLTEVLDKAPVTIAYPDGKYTRQAIEAARSAGVRVGMSMYAFCNRLPVAEDSTTIMALGRYLPCACHDMHAQLDLFKANIALRHRFRAFMMSSLA